MFIAEIRFISNNMFDGGVIVPITEYVEKYGINMEEQYGEYAKFAYNAGEVYGIPVVRLRGDCGIIKRFLMMLELSIRIQRFL